MPNIRRFRPEKRGGRPIFKTERFARAPQPFHSETRTEREWEDSNFPARPKRKGSGFRGKRRTPRDRTGTKRLPTTEATHGTIRFSTPPEESFPNFRATAFGRRHRWQNGLRRYPYRKRGRRIRISPWHGRFFKRGRKRGFRHSELPRKGARILQRECLARVIRSA